MKKIEIIWRELLYQSIEKRKRQFTQKDVAAQFGFSTSTVFQALKAPRKMGAVKVTGRFFTLEDPEKLLYHWASERNFSSDIILSGRVNLPIFEIEGQMPPDVIFGGYTASRQYLTAVPADYDQVYVYTQDIKEIQNRFKLGKTGPNLIVLTADSYMTHYGGVTTLAQTFVDLWNLSHWQAKEFVKALKEKLDELLP